MQSKQLIIEFRYSYTCDIPTSGCLLVRFHMKMSILNHPCSIISSVNDQNCRPRQHYNTLMYINLNKNVLLLLQIFLKKHNILVGQSGVIRLKGMWYLRKVASSCKKFFQFLHVCAQNTVCFTRKGTRLSEIFLFWHNSTHKALGRTHP